MPQNRLTFPAPLPNSPVLIARILWKKKKQEMKEIPNLPRTKQKLRKKNIIFHLRSCHQRPHRLQISHAKSHISLFDEKILMSKKNDSGIFLFCRKLFFLWSLDPWKGRSNTVTGYRLGRYVTCQTTTVTVRLPRQPINQSTLGPNLVTFNEAQSASHSASDPYLLNFCFSVCLFVSVKTVDKFQELFFLKFFVKSGKRWKLKYFLGIYSTGLKMSAESRLQDLFGSDSDSDDDARKASLRISPAPKSVSPAEGSGSEEGSQTPVVQPEGSDAEDDDRDESSQPPQRTSGFTRVPSDVEDDAEEDVTPSVVKGEEDSGVWRIRKLLNIPPLGRLIDRLTDGSVTDTFSIDRLIDWLIDWLLHCTNSYLIDYLLFYSAIRSYSLSELGVSFVYLFFFLAGKWSRVGRCSTERRGARGRRRNSHRGRHATTGADFWRAIFLLEKTGFSPRKLGGFQCWGVWRWIWGFRWGSPIGSSTGRPSGRQEYHALAMEHHGWWHSHSGVEYKICQVVRWKVRFHQNTPIRSTVDWLINDRLIDWLIDQLIDWLID